jgi:hypothetical protein
MPFRHERRFVAELDVALDPVGQFILAGDLDLTQNRPRHFQKKISPQFSQDAWVGLKISSQRPGLLSRKRWVSRERWAE